MTHLHNRGWAHRFHAAVSCRDRPERRDCSIPARLTTRHGEVGCRIINVSLGGVGFTVDAIIRLRPDERVVVFSRHTERLFCNVRWASLVRYGAEFEIGAGIPETFMRFYASL